MVIEAPLAKVWHFIKLPDFAKFWNNLDKSEFVKGASSEVDLVKWAFKDGTTLEVKQEEHSVSAFALHEWFWCPVATSYRLETSNHFMCFDHRRTVRS